MTTIQSLVAEAGLKDKAQQIDDRLIRLQWGSAFVIAGISGSAVIAVSPIFKTMPSGKETAFYRRLLELNASMGGVAAFAVQADGWVVLQSGRALKGIDGQEFAALVTAVGKFADQYDDELIAEFYAGKRPPLVEDDDRVPTPTSSADVSGAQLPQTD